MNFRLLLLAGLTALPLRGAERLSLAEAARRATARDFGIQAADSQADSARRAQAQARLAHFPRLEAGSTFTRGDEPVYVFASLLDQERFTSDNFDIHRLNRPGSVSHFKSYLQLGVPLFEGYAIKNGEKLADLAAHRAESLARGGRQELRLAVFEAWVEVLRLKQLSRRLDETLASSVEEIRSAERLRAQGLVLGSDFFAAQAILSGLKSWKIQIDKAQQATQESLAILIGTPAGDFVVGGSLRGAWPALPSETELQNLARTDRMDLRVAFFERQQAEVAATREKQTFLPRVDALAQAETDTRNFSSNPCHRLLMVRARWVLGDPSYGDRAREAAAKARAAQQRQSAVEEQGRREVLQSLRRYEGLTDALPLLEQMVEQAQRSLELFRPLYREGRQSIFDVLRAEEALARADDQRCSTLAQLHVQRTKILAAAGILDEGALAALSDAMEKP